MLWALLITLLIAKISGGPEEIFMTPNLEKQVNTHVIDKARRREIIQVTKKAKKEIKAFGNFRKSKLKQIKKMGASREISTEHLQVTYQTNFDGRVSMQLNLVDQRIDVQHLLKDEEWKLIIEDAVLPSDKLRKKNNKKESKEDENIEKFLVKLEKVITDNVADPQKSRNIVDALHIFSKTLHEFIAEGQTMNFEDSELIRNKDASKKISRIFINDITSFA